MDTILCLDSSGSMAGFLLRELKASCEIFIQGVEETARLTGLKENVSVVEFGKHQRVLVPLTNDYQLVRNRFNSLEAGGQTPMAEGLINSLKEILENGGPLRIGDIRLCPRIILITDGKPTSQGKTEDDAKFEVLVHALLFGAKHKEAGLPYPIPIACVGIGDSCDNELLATIAKVTGGMYRHIDDISELGEFFLQQMLLIKFIIEFQQHLEDMTNLIVLREYFQRMGQDLDDEEALVLMLLLLALIGKAEDEEITNQYTSQRQQIRQQQQQPQQPQQQQQQIQPRPIQQQPRPIQQQPKQQQISSNNSPKSPQRSGELGDLTEEELAFVLAEVNISNKMKCPICSKEFPEQHITSHAATCGNSSTPPPKKKRTRRTKRLPLSNLSKIFY